MSDELLVEDVEINLDESQIIGSEDEEVHASEEPDDGCSAIIVDDGSSTPENPGMLICTRAGHQFLIDAEDRPGISRVKWSVSSDGVTGCTSPPASARRRSTCTECSSKPLMVRG